MTADPAEAEIASFHGHRILAVIVLYRRAPQESQALQSLTSLLLRKSSAASSFACVVYDNSSELQALPDLPLPVLYRHDASNPGLACAYNFGLTVAARSSIPWLLLLDQDTTVTSEFLEDLSLSEQKVIGSPEIVAIAPKLMQDGDLLSPHWPLFHRLHSSLANAYGPSTSEIRVFNSGSALRTAALTAIGGFPKDFPLDFLDHTVYRQLQRRGGRVFLLRSVLQHELGSKYSRVERDYKESARIRSILLYESRYFRIYGTALERIIHSLRRSLVAVRLVARRQSREAREVLRVTFRDV